MTAQPGGRGPSAVSKRHLAKAAKKESCAERRVRLLDDIDALLASLDDALRDATSQGSSWLSAELSQLARWDKADVAPR